jgi:hypothetical protein
MSKHRLTGTRPQGQPLSAFLKQPAPPAAPKTDFVLATTAKPAFTIALSMRNGSSPTDC